MNKRISLINFEFISFIFILVFGTLSHYLYNLSNHNILIGLFSPINESVWEHLKLTFFPTLITLITGFIYYKNEYINSFKSKFIGLVYALIFTIVSFYTYSGIIGHHILLIDISIFIISCFVIFIYSLKNYKFININIYFLLFTLIFIFLLFILFTFIPLDINLFK